MERTDDWRPIGTWIRIDEPSAGCQPMLGYTYFDRNEGLCAATAPLAHPEPARAIAESPRVVRLDADGSGPTWRPLSRTEIDRLGLPAAPLGMELGNAPGRPRPENPWRRHPKLRGRFRADHPDDLQVLIHDGSPRVGGRPPEVAWVRTTGMDGDVFRGVLLNRPNRLTSVRRGDEIRFVVAGGAAFPILVTEAYLRERPSWTIHPCGGCGVTEMLDPPSAYLRAAFPGQAPDALMVSFTAFCPLCGGILVVEDRAAAALAGAAEEDDGPSPPEPALGFVWSWELRDAQDHAVCFNIVCLTEDALYARLNRFFRRGIARIEERLGAGFPPELAFPAGTVVIPLDRIRRLVHSERAGLLEIDHDGKRSPVSILDHRFGNDRSLFEMLGQRLAPDATPVDGTLSGGSSIEAPLNWLGRSVPALMLALWMLWRTARDRWAPAAGPAGPADLSGAELVGVGAIIVLGLTAPLAMLGWLLYRYTHPLPARVIEIRHTPAGSSIPTGPSTHGPA